MSASENPVIPVFKRLLDPAIIWGLLYLSTRVYGQTFTGHYLVLVVITFFTSSYVYERTCYHRLWHSGKILAYVRDTFVGWGIVAAILLVLGYAADLFEFYSERVVLTWFIAVPIAFVASHITMRMVSARMRKNGGNRTAIIVGANDTSLALIQRVAELPDLIIDIRGYFDARNGTRILEGYGPRLGEIDDVADYVRKHHIKMVFISLPMSVQPRIRKIVDDLHDATSSIYFLLDVSMSDLMQARTDHLSDIPMIALCESPFTGINGVVKNVSDLLLATLMLLLLSPLMLGIALVVKLTSPGPVIFQQRRYGLNSEEIIVYKFRTMTVCEDGAQVAQAQKNDPRITRIGAFLRRTSMDELPQLINVLQGRMSLVGPRPHAVAHNELYRKLIKGYMLRHKVKPGITGWAQVNGLRGETETVEKMKARIDLDLNYLKNWSIWLDLWILVRTVWVVLRKDNAY